MKPWEDISGGSKMKNTWFCLYILLATFVHQFIIPMIVLDNKSKRFNWNSDCKATTRSASYSSLWAFFGYTSENYCALNMWQFTRTNKIPYKDAMMQHVRGSDRGIFEWSLMEKLTAISVFGWHRGGKVIPIPYPTIQESPTKNLKQLYSWIVSVGYFMHID